MEPSVVNTVSYFRVSAVIEILASGEVMKLSFRHENKHPINKEKKTNKQAFIAPNLSQDKTGKK